MFASLVTGCALLGFADAVDATRIMPPGLLPPDGRLDRPRNLDDYHPWTPPASVAEWEKRKKFLRTQVLVSQGLWPLPERTPLEPVVHGKVDRGDYTIEKVYLRTRPGHYLAGNLYRPKSATGKRPTVLFAHGHWANGRMYDAGEASAAGDIKSGGESFPPNSRYPLQALPATLAKLGYIAFAYDMIGYADSARQNHPRSTLGLFNGGMEDAESLLRLQSFMGMQTWNSIRALDWICSLPDVDASRIAVTGGSGGGTQTFMLCAVDDRPAVSFPTVMVSTGMQGGCVCENAPLLRVGTTNIELAALHGPKPLGMTGANDWTKEIDTKGLPDLKKFYRMFGKEDSVAAFSRIEFGHNYNQVSREYFYAWLSKHFMDGKAPVKETQIAAMPPKALSVFDAEHPRAPDDMTWPEFKREWRKQDAAAWAKLQPTDASSFQAYLQIVRPALAAMMVDEMPTAKQVSAEARGSAGVGDTVIQKYLLSRVEAPVLYRKEAVPVAVFRKEAAFRENAPTDRLLVWIDADGKTALWDAKANAPTPTLKKLLEAGYAVAAPDVFLTGEYASANGVALQPAVDKRYAGYNHCYNRSAVGNRVHDILTTIAFAKARLKPKSTALAGFGAAGAWTILAKGLAGNAVDRTACELGPWRFRDVKDPDDPRLVPGGLKYGDLLGLAVCAVSEPLYLADGARLRDAEKRTLANGFVWSGAKENLTLGDSQAAAVEWLLKR